MSTSFPPQAQSQGLPKQHQPVRATQTPFPIQTRTASASILNMPTTATLHLFNDKILLTLTQNGLLNHWLHVPLVGASPLSDPTTYLAPPSTFNDYDEDGGEGGKKEDTSLLPFPHLTATTVLGGTREEDVTVAQTLAVTLASAVVVKRPDEGRMVVLGLGLERMVDSGGERDGERERERFEGLIGLCLEVL